MYDHGCILVEIQNREQTRSIFVEVVNHRLGFEVREGLEKILLLFRFWLSAVKYNEEKRREEYACHRQ